MDRPPTRLIRRPLSLQHLDHQSLAALLDGLVEEDLDVLDVAGVLRGGEGELLLDRLEMLAEELTTGFEVLVEEGLLAREKMRVKEREERISKPSLPSSLPPPSRTHLPIQVKQIESEQVNLDLDILGLHVLPLPPTELLERQEALLVLVPGDGFGVDHEGGGAVGGGGVDGL